MSKSRNWLFLALLISVVVLFGTSCVRESNTVIYELPENFSGSLVIEFDCERGTNLETDANGNLVIYVRSNDKIVTSFPYEKFKEYRSERYHWNGESDKVQLSQTIAGPLPYGEGKWVKKPGYCTTVFKSTNKDNEFREDSTKQMLCDCVERSTEAKSVYKSSGKQIRTTYPFNSSDKIEVISYFNRIEPKWDDNIIKNGKIDVEKVIERVELNPLQTDSLFSILHNYVGEGERQPADCYLPRHSILFYKGGVPFAFIEVCFECKRLRYSKGLEYGDLYPDKICRLQGFVKSLGIKEGIQDEFCF